jgi:phosphatidylserine decarboxylase
MDPFVVTSLGRKTLRTPVIRHNLNPVYNEKMVFQVMKHEQLYTMSFTVMDRDKFSGNDFVASAGFPLQTLIQAGPDIDPDTGLYQFSEEDMRPPAKSDAKISPVPSSSNLSRPSKHLARSRSSTTSLSTQQQEPQSVPSLVLPEQSASSSISDGSTAASPVTSESDGLRVYEIPLTLKNKERWEDKHFPQIIVKAKYMPYRALRQQFWRLMLRQYDADDSGSIDKVELTTMLDTLGSTLKESTIDSFFERFSEENSSGDPSCLTFDQVVMCLEDTLQSLQKDPRTMGKKFSPATSTASQESDSEELNVKTSSSQPTNVDSQVTSVPTMTTEQTSGDEDLHPDDLGDERGEEHVIELRECPLCHQPRLSKRSDADIITHIATCASQDWRQVDNLVMGGFVTSSQAQRKWYSKVITKISYGGYKLGANSANILVQDRITGQINEERMSVYVRLGIRLLYKGLKSREMEKKRSKAIQTPTLLQG